jgi:hypothetical protein
MSDTQSAEASTMPLRITFSYTLDDAHEADAAMQAMQQQPSEWRILLPAAVTVVVAVLSAVFVDEVEDLIVELGLGPLHRYAVAIPWILILTMVLVGFAWNWRRTRPVTVEEFIFTKRRRFPPTAVAMITVGAVTAGVAAWSVIRGDVRDNEDWARVLKPMVPWLLGTAAVAWFYLQSARGHVAAEFERNPVLQLSRSVIVDEEKLVCDDTQVKMELRWSLVKRIVETPKIIMLWTSDTFYFVVPKRAFEDEAHAEAFREVLRRNVQGPAGAFPVVQQPANARA